MNITMVNVLGASLLENLQKVGQNALFPAFVATVCSLQTSSMP